MNIREEFAEKIANVLDVNTQLYYDDQTGLPLLKMMIDYEDGILEIPAIDLNKLYIDREYGDIKYGYINTKGVISCNLTIPLRLSEGIYAKFQHKYPVVNKVYNINNNLIVGVDQSRNKDKTCLCFSKFKDGKFTVERCEYIEKQEDIDKYIEDNKYKWV